MLNTGKKYLEMPQGVASVSCSSNTADIQHTGKMDFVSILLWNVQIARQELLD